MIEIVLHGIPEPVRERFLQTLGEVDEINTKALAALKTKYNGKIQFQYEHSAPGDILTPFERAQSVCFVTRYEYLPILESIGIIETNGKYYLGNMAFIRHILNEYRSIIVNQSNSIYYSKIHRFCYQKLTNRNPKEDLTITVKDESGQDITDAFTRILGERNKAIKIILKCCEFDYIYNGILQHSDHRYTERFWDDYYSGRLNYIFLKHAFLLDNIKEHLYWHYVILNNLTFPKLGPL